MSEAGLSRILGRLVKSPSMLQDIGEISSDRMRKEYGAMASDLLLRLGTTVDVQQVSGIAHILRIATPQAVLSHFVKESPAFKEVMQLKLRCHPLPWRLCAYHDEITAGNVLRPDNKRKICAIYISFLEFGSHLLRNELLWLPIAIVKHDVAANSVGSLSGVLLQVFKVCFGRTRLDEGVMLQLARPTMFLFRGSNLLADEAALKATWSVKGASGIKPCMLCKSVLQKGTLFGAQPYLIEIDNDDLAKFDRMSNADWYLIADHLVLQATLLNKGQMEQLEKCSGLNCNPDGLLFDAEMREIVDPMITTFDSMHVYYNHGVASNETHAFLEAAHQKCGLTYARIHAYISSAGWKPPSSMHSKIDPAKVFTEARSRASKDNLKSMATELLAVLPLLRQLAATTLATHAGLQPELQSFFAMCKCVDILQQLKSSAAPSVDACNELRVAQRQHLLLHKACYGSEHIKPKNHYAFHIPDQIIRDGVLLDAFTLERKHKNAKRLATTVANGRDFESSVLSRLLAEQLASMPDSFCADALVGRQADCPEVANAIGEDACTVSERARCHGVNIQVNDVLLANNQAMQVLACVSCSSGIALLIKPFDFIEKWGYASKWRPCNEICIFSFACAFSMPPYWTMDGGMLYTL